MILRVDDEEKALSVLTENGYTGPSFIN